MQNGSLCLGGIVGLSMAIIVVLLVVAVVVIIWFVRRSRQRNQGDWDMTIINGFSRHWLMDWPPYDDIQFPRENLSLMKEIGHGQFGQVYLATAKGIIKGEAESLVAVKTMKEGTRELADDFRKEINIMREFDSPYIVKLLGVCTAEEPVYLIVEFMSCGNLKDFVIGARPDQKTGQQAKLSVQQLVSICRQVAAGVSYMASLRFVHRDIAARNCLVDEDLVVKVADFGMSRDVYQADYYKRHGGVIPLRWMAPEAIKDGRYTVESDVWALGVVIWEVFSLGHQPYYGMGNQEVLHGICDGNVRLEKPPGCPEVIYRMMRSCWESQPHQRATASRLVEQLRTLEENSSDDADGYEVPLPLICLANEEQAELDESRFCDKHKAGNVFDDKDKGHYDNSVRLHGTDGCEAYQNWMDTGMQTESGEKRYCDMGEAISDNKKVRDIPAGMERPSRLTTAVHTNHPSQSLYEVSKANTTSSPTSPDEDLPLLETHTTQQSASTPIDVMHGDAVPPYLVVEDAEMTTPM